MPTPSVAVLQITLDDIEPTVMRRVVVPADIRLDRLHLVIQAALGWTNSHLYEFQIGGAGWGEPDPDGIYDGPLAAKKGRLSAVLADAGRKTFSYLYDFGDSWSHTVNRHAYIAEKRHALSAWSALALEIVGERVRPSNVSDIRSAVA